MNSIKNSSSPSVGKANTLFSTKQDFKTVSYVSLFIKATTKILRNFIEHFWNCLSLSLSADACENFWDL